MLLKPGALFVVVTFLLVSVAHATDLSGTISTPTALPSGTHHLVGNLTITAPGSLTLAAGATLQVSGNYGLSVYGSLVCNGTPASTCYVGASTSGTWQGITILTGGSVVATSTTFSGAHTDLTDNGGTLNLSACKPQSATLDGIAAYGASALQISSCDFFDCHRRGIFLVGSAVTGSVGACTFNTIGEYPVLAQAALVHLLAGPFTFIAAVTDPFIGVSCSADQDITGNDTWAWLGFDYDLRAGSSTELNIAPGAHLTLNPGVRLRGGSIHVEGTLTAGGIGAPVYLYGPSGDTGSPGDWPGLDTSGGVVSLTNTIVRDAANAIVADGGSVTITNSSLLRSQFFGLDTVHAAALAVSGCAIDSCGRSGVTLSSATTGSIATTSISGCTEWPIYALANAVGVLGAGLTFSGNAVSTIAVNCSLDPDVTTSQTWHAQPLPYDLAGDTGSLVCAIAPAATLTIDPGVTLLTGGLDVRGSLQVHATSVAPVLLTSPRASPVPGDCLGLAFEAGSTGFLSYVSVEYGQTGFTVTSSSPTLTHLRAVHCSQDGLAVSGAGATPVVYWSTFTDNSRYGVFIASGAQPDLGDLTNGDPADDGMNTLAPNSGAYDLYNSSAANIQAQNNWWATTQTATISARIFDHTENPTYGVVTFLPIRGTAPNTAPTLDWLGTGAYVGVGLAPQVGTPSTTFVWKILYRDADANPPAYVRVHILSAGVEITGSPFTMTLEGAANYASGATFTYQRTLPAGRAYTYYFDAADAQTAATGTPTSAQSGPIVTNAPTLAFTGQPGYEAGGFTPPSGFANDTLFDWRVTYTDPDGDAPTGVFLHLLLNGVDVTGSPFAMTRISGAYATGAIFQVLTTIPTASDTGLTYYFVASDGVFPATGPPTTPHQGPSVQFRPFLTFPTDVGFELTGVSPQAGLATGIFHFEVIYSDAGGVVPSSVVVHIFLGGVEIAGSPFTLTALDSGSIFTGRRYGADIPLPASKDYTHYFDAIASGISAYGPATKSVAGPISDRAPSLVYPAAGVGAGTGLDPSTGGLGATLFTWRVTYSDPDSDAPRFAVVHLFRDGAEIPGSPFDLAPEVGGDYLGGKTYSIQKRLTQSGSWQYSFAASDSYFDATGAATSVRSGPSLTGSFSLVPLDDLVAVNGLSPSVGEASDTPFTFAVTYTSPSSTPPVSINVIVMTDGEPATAQTFPLAALDNQSLVAGRVYTTTTTFPHGNYSFYFQANDGTNTVRTDEFHGPLINTRPHLTFVGDPGYVTDGFDPDTGTSGKTSFVFRVRYTDADGDAPVKNRLIIYTRADLKSPAYYAMTAETSGADPRNGIVYRVATTLGVYTDGIRYRFDFDDGYSAADGDPSIVAIGPTVSVAPLSAPMVFAAHAYAGPGLATIECSATRTDLVAEGQVLNLAGRTIATVAGSVDVAARKIRFVWPYTTRSGTKAPPGQYLFVIRASAATGESFRQILHLTIPRR